LQDGYEKEAKRFAYPRRALSAGLRGALEFFLVVKESNIDPVCSRVPAFLLYFHTPGDIPNKRKHPLVMPINYLAQIRISPNMIKTSKELKKYRPEKRQCFFEKERYLKYFESYTQNNCELECIANITLKKCGCVKHAIPRFEGTPICPYIKLDCCSDAEDTLSEGQNLFSDDVHTKSEGCNCLPTCTSINYKYEVTQTPLDPKDFEMPITIDGELDSTKDSSIVAVSVILEESTFMHMKRIELYSWRDFIANCGGLLGLFLGISLVSIIEIFYYLTLRIWVNFREPLKQNEITHVRTTTQFHPHKVFRH
jgi:acid-sensing ion channel, other